MTLERIAEIEAAGADPKLDQGVMLIAELPELCRLARLGLRVEAAPVVGDFPWIWAVTPEVAHKRVALVVLEGSE